MLNWIIKSFINYWSCSKGVTKLNILTYHRVSKLYDATNPETIHLALFTRQIQWLKKYFIVLPLSEALTLQAKGSLPARAVCITVDDGYRDSYEFIYKTLKQEGVVATFFISTKGIVDGGLWDAEIYSAIFNAPEQVKKVNCGGKTFDISGFEQRVNGRYQLTNFTKYLSLVERKKVIEELKEQTHFHLLDQYFLTETQIKIMHENGMSIGAHTHNHPILMKEEDSIAFDEIKQSKAILESIIKEPVEFFAYPNGKYGLDYTDVHINMVDELEFRAAFSTDWGSLGNIEKECFKIKRFTPWDETELSFTLRLAINYRK
jgi:peptidoglycan/xylan/chitin deacetylase (PgdA/CDA1 family)